MYFLYFFRKKRLDGLPRFLGKNSSGCKLDEGSLFSESDWLIAASAVSPSATFAGPLPIPEELASSDALTSALTHDFLAVLSASVTNILRRGMTSQPSKVWNFYFFVLLLN